MARVPTTFFGTIYVGVTAGIARRAWEHREGMFDGSTRKYSSKRLVYFKQHAEIGGAIKREKAIKHWPRA